MRINASYYTFLSLLMGSGSFAATLPIEAFLEQVRNDNQAYRGALRTAEGARLRSEESSLLFSPYAVASAQWSRDSRETVNPAFMGTRSDRSLYSVGFTQTTRFGLGAKFTYGLAHSSLYGVNSQFVQTPQFYETQPLLELTFPLWRNRFSAETKAQEQVATASARAASWNESYRGKVILAEAENAYWRLALAREALQVQMESVDRAEKIRSWSKRRADLGLADPSDLYQAEANLQVRTLELQAARDDEASAARAFNRVRGMREGPVPEDLVLLKDDELEALAVPLRNELRDDVKANQEMELAAAANSELGLHRNSPVLELFGSLSLNGREVEMKDAISESFRTDHPQTAAGVRFTAPFLPWDIRKVSRNREGYRQEAQGAAFNASRKFFEQEHEWKDLTTRFKEAKQRLKLASSIVRAQETKVVHERQRNTKGRTTTYQVLIFEQDYSLAQLNRIRIVSEILSLHAQLKTFGGPQT